MPTYRERVTICPARSGEPVWVGDFPIWWQHSEFLKKYETRKIDTGNPFYVDYGILLTVGEALVWDKHCRQLFAHDPRSQLEAVQGSMEQWATLLNNAGWVIVESYEWESGFE
jgi:hypothetical protein